MNELMQVFSWSDIWIGISPLLGVVIGGLITYKITTRQVNANIEISKRAQWHQSVSEWRKVQYEAFRSIQSNLWQVVVLASYARDAADRALELATIGDMESHARAIEKLRPLQDQARDVLHKLEIDIALLGDEVMRKQLDDLRKIGMQLTMAFTDQEEFLNLHCQYTKDYERFRNKVSQNVLTIMLAPVPIEPA